MKTEIKKEYGISEYRIAVTPSEMEMIARSREMCKHILDNHASSKDKKIYLDDTQVETMYAIFACISKGYILREQNSIEAFLGDLHNPSEEIKKDVESKENECV